MLSDGAVETWYKGVLSPQMFVRIALPFGKQPPSFSVIVISTMFSKYLTTLAVIASTICGVTAKTDLPIPASGVYRIQNSDSGLYMDAFNSDQTSGTPVIVQTLNQPFTANQEWTWDLQETPFGEIKSISSLVTTNDTANGLEVILDPFVANSITLVSVIGGVAICLNPFGAGCFTGSNTPETQITVEEFTGAESQIWIFQPVGN